MVLEVKKVGTRVKVILSRGHRDLVRYLFMLEVPEIADGIIDIRRIEREPGYRTKLAVHSTDDKVDCVGACVGVRGTRIKSIIDELGGERIDIIRWSTEPDVLIANALKPAEISHIELEPSTRKALVLVDEDQLSLAIGRKGQNVRLASKLAGWEIDIMTRAELEESIHSDGDGEAGSGGEAAGDSPTTPSAADLTDSDNGTPATSVAEAVEDAAAPTDPAPTAPAPTDPTPTDPAPDGDESRRDTPDPAPPTES
jgi:transcription antitermination factor NusA-like protein